MDLKEFGKRLKAARKKAGLSAQYVADEASVSRSTVTNIEGGINDPSLGTLMKMIDAIGLKSIDLLLYDSFESEPAVLDLLAKPEVLDVLSDPAVRKILTNKDLLDLLTKMPTLDECSGEYVIMLLLLRSTIEFIKNHENTIRQIMIDELK